jgi:hypothetical protein
MYQLVPKSQLGGTFFGKMLQKTHRIFGSIVFVLFLWQCLLTYCNTGAQLSCESLLFINFFGVIYSLIPLTRHFFHSLDWDRTYRGAAMHRQDKTPGALLQAFNITILWPTPFVSVSSRFCPSRGKSHVGETSESLRSGHDARPHLSVRLPEWHTGSVILQPSPSSGPALPLLAIFD